MSPLTASLIIVASAGALFLASCVFVLRWIFLKTNRGTDGRLAVLSVGSFACCLIVCLLVSDFFGNFIAAIFASSVLLLSIAIGLVLFRAWKRMDLKATAETERLRELLAVRQTSSPSLAEQCAYVARALDLTRREEEILELLIKGMKQQEVADELFVSANTIKTHTRNLYRKMGVKTKESLVEKAASLGIKSTS